MWARRAIFIIAATLPVVIYVWKFSIANRHGIFFGEDWDEFAQMYEAARITIVHYHQFPWWNSWSLGGEPLFANPQFGLFSLQMLLVLAFGTVAGLHYAMFVYFILGFWGMYLLLKHIAPDKRVICLLLSYVWVFSGFTAMHLGGGHFTFTAYMLAPWAFLSLLIINRRYGWLWFGLVISALVLSSVHYISVETIIICMIAAIVQIAREIFRRHHHLLIVLRPYIASAVVAVLLSGVRLLYTFQFLHEFPRVFKLIEPSESLKLFAAVLLERHYSLASSFSHGALYSWAEYGDYIGLITLALFGYLLVKRLRHIKSMHLGEWFLLAGMVLAALLTFGMFSPYSPWALLHHLPGFRQMDVPYRFIGWLAFALILFLARLPKKPAVIALLAISVIDVFLANYPNLAYAQKPYVPPRHRSAQFEQYQFFDTNPARGQMAILGEVDFRLLRATQSNYGEIYGYDPILRIEEYYPPTYDARCGINHGCRFVMTHNAKVTSWSPNHIVLTRTDPGPIELDMNPGKVWTVNGKAIYRSDKILRLGQNFIVNDPSHIINVDFSPVL